MLISCILGVPPSRMLLLGEILNLCYVNLYLEGIAGFEPTSVYPCSTVLPYFLNYIPVVDLTGVEPVSIASDFTTSFTVIAFFKECFLSWGHLV